MKQTNLMLGYDDGNFKPNQFITRGEIAAVILRFIDKLINEQRTSYSFPDIENHWARDQIETIRELGIMVGDKGIFYPNRYLTRNEAVTAINKAIHRGTLTGDFSQSWPDVSPSNWGYGHIEEASRTHESTRISIDEELLIRFID